MTLAISSCNEEELVTVGDGKVILTAGFDSRSVDVQQELYDSCTVFIYNEKYLIRNYEGIDNLPSELWLSVGNYVAEAWAGDSVPASFDAKYYKAYLPFVIEKDVTTNVDLKCTLANVVTSVKYDSEVVDALQDYTLTVRHTKGALKFDGNDTRKGFFMMPNGVNDLTWTLSATTFDGKPFSTKGTIANVKSATEYTINVKYTGNLPEVGASIVEISVDESEVQVNQSVEVENAPEIWGYDFEISEPITDTTATVGDKIVCISSITTLKSLTINCDYLTTLGFENNEYNFIGMSEDIASALLAKGIKCVYQENSGQANAVINFSKYFTDNMPIGEYDITIEAIDASDRKTNKHLKLNLIQAE